MQVINHVTCSELKKNENYETRTTKKQTMLLNILKVFLTQNILLLKGNMIYLYMFSLKIDF